MQWWHQFFIVSDEYYSGICNISYKSYIVVFFYIIPDNDKDTNSTDQHWEEWMQYSNYSTAYSTEILKPDSLSFMIEQLTNICLKLDLPLNW